MIDQSRAPVPEETKSYRSDSQSDTTSGKNEKKETHTNEQVDVIAMVRSLQRTAGLTDCFRSGNVDCGDIDCDWRTYCVGVRMDHKKQGTRFPDK